MDANPLGMRPGAQIDDGGESVGVYVLAAGKERVQRGDCSSQGLLEHPELLCDLAGRDAFMSADPDPYGLETRLSAEASHASDVRHREASHRAAVPSAQIRERWDLAARGAVPSVAQNFGEVLAQAWAVRVPVSHE